MLRRYASSQSNIFWNVLPEITTYGKTGLRKQSNPRAPANAQPANINQQEARTQAQVLMLRPQLLESKT